MADGYRVFSWQFRRSRHLLFAVNCHENRHEKSARERNPDGLVHVCYTEPIGSARLGSARPGSPGSPGSVLRCACRLGSQARLASSARLWSYSRCASGVTKRTLDAYTSVRSLDAMQPFRSPGRWTSGCTLDAYHGKNGIRDAGRIGRDGAPPTGYVPAGASVHDSYTVGI